MYNTKPSRTLGIILASLMLVSTNAFAHCDTMSGPVVLAGQKALEQGDVRHALVWVQPANEAEIRAAFTQAMAVRSRGEDARALADRYFFETLVRVHRAGEGAPYTGLKRADTQVEPGIAEAEHALEMHSSAELKQRLTAALDHQLEQAYQRVHRAKGFAPTDVEAGRRFVEAYVQYIHYVERLHQAIVPSGHGHAEPEAPHVH
ncbi:MAG: hypothetical protein IT282_04620 [Bacteroidetes bacterium]|nr:hypothetical protein [Bacteroidota bacterium]